MTKQRGTAGQLHQTALNKNSQKGSQKNSQKSSQTRPKSPPKGPSETPPNFSSPADDNNNPLFFFKADEPHGEFCQWYPARFSVTKADMSAALGGPVDAADPEGWAPAVVGFRSAEQFMMYCKAGCFGDVDTQRQVLAAGDDARETKRLGRQTRGFDAARWDAVKRQVVVAGNRAKFGQNAPLRQKLLATGRRLLAEASSVDRVWGIGLTADEAARRWPDRSAWGENLLGEALMEVRAELADRQ